VYCLPNGRANPPGSCGRPEGDATPVEGNDASVVIRLSDDQRVSRNLDELGLSSNACRAVIRSGVAAPEHWSCIVSRHATRVQVSESLHADLRVSGLCRGPGGGLRFCASGSRRGSFHPRGPRSRMSAGLAGPDFASRPSHTLSNRNGRCSD